MIDDTGAIKKTEWILLFQKRCLLKHIAIILSEAVIVKLKVPLQVPLKVKVKGQGEGQDIVRSGQVRL